MQETVERVVKLTRDEVSQIIKKELREKFGPVWSNKLNVTITFPDNMGLAENGVTTCTYTDAIKAPPERPTTRRTQ